MRKQCDIFSHHSAITFVMDFECLSFDDGAAIVLLV